MSDAGTCHISQSTGKLSFANINDNFVQSESLRLVNSDSPSQLER